MTDERSPWARPDPGQRDRAGITLLGPGPSAGVAGPGPSPGPVSPADREPPAARPRTPAATGYRAGTVTGAGSPYPGGPPAPGGPPGAPPLAVPGRPPRPPVDLARRNRLMLRWFGAGAGIIVVIGLVILLAMAMTGGAGRLLQRASGPPDTRPLLAKLCPPPSVDPGGPAPVLPPPPGPRTVDDHAGISYRAYGPPWEPWDQVWTAGTLHVAYRTGQHFITERYLGGDYHASILSGSVPAAVNDGLVLDLKCTGHQVAADARASYYPQPNTIEMMREEQTVLGGRPAWLTVFRLHFHQEGLTATEELVGLALIDMGRPEAAVLYVSIPGTHRQFDHVVNEVLDSVRPV